MSDFWKALILIAVPIVALSVLSTVEGPFDQRDLAGPGILGVWWLAAALWLVAAIVWRWLRKGKKALASGILAGIGIGLVSLALTCSANLGGL